MLSPDDQRHGTTRGYTQGCKCKPCLAAHAKRARDRRKRRDVLGEHAALSALGSQRRIEALHTLGWRQQDIAEAGGWHSQKAIDNLMKRTRVLLGTAKRVDDVYRSMCMSIGPSEKTRRYAARQGWAPPLAWTNIDTDAGPAGMRGAHEPASKVADCVVVDAICAGERIGELNVADRRAVVVRLRARGRTVSEIALRCGVSPEVVEMDLRRTAC